jgi:hypothetical protein
MLRRVSLHDGWPIPALTTDRALSNGLMSIGIVALLPAFCPIPAFTGQVRKPTEKHGK